MEMFKKKMSNHRIFFSYAEGDTEIVTNLIDIFIKNGIDENNIFSYNTERGFRLSPGDNIDKIKKEKIKTCDKFIQIYTHHTRKSVKSIQEYSYAEMLDKDILLIKHDRTKTEYFGEDSRIYMRLDENSVKKTVRDWFLEFNITKVQENSITDGMSSTCKSISKKFTSKGSYHRYPFLRAKLSKNICDEIKSRLRDIDRKINNKDSINRLNKSTIEKELILLQPEYSVITEKNNAQNRIQTALSHLGYDAPAIPEDLKFSRVIDSWQQNNTGKKHNLAQFTYRQIYSFFKEGEYKIKEENNLFISAKGNKYFLPKVTRKDCDGEGNYEFHIYLIEFNPKNEFFIFEKKDSRVFAKDQH